MPARIAFWGTAEFAVPILERLFESPWCPALVVTTPDRPAGRGNEMESPPVKIAAEKLDIPVIQPERLSPTPHPLFPDAAWDLFIVAAYGKILPRQLLEIPRLGALNIHPSLLPRFRGASPIQYTILSGGTETGVSIIRMDEEVDHGPIVASSKFKIPAGAEASADAEALADRSAGRQNSKVTTPELSVELSHLAAGLLLETLPLCFEGKILPEAQDHERATFTKLLTREDGHIDWAKTATEIEAMTRAFLPWPGAYAFWNRGANRLRLGIEAAEIESAPPTPSTTPGMVARSGATIAVACTDGRLRLQRLRPEGGRSMSGEDFLRGHPDIVGTVLT